MHRIHFSLTSSWVRKLVVALAVVAGLLIAQHRRAHAESNKASEEFVIKRKYMHDRVDNFYERLDELDKYDNARNSAAGEKHDERKKQFDNYEKAREQYVKDRKAKPPEDPAAFEKELKARAEQREKDRLEFVKHRDELERESRGFDSIPQDEEYGVSIEDIQATEPSSVQPTDQ